MRGSLRFLDLCVGLIGLLVGLLGLGSGLLGLRVGLLGFGLGLLGLRVGSLGLGLGLLCLRLGFLGLRMGLLCLHLRSLRLLCRGLGLPSQFGSFRIGLLPASLSRGDRFLALPVALSAGRGHTIQRLPQGVELLLPGEDVRLPLCDDVSTRVARSLSGGQIGCEVRAADLRFPCAQSRRQTEIR